MPDNSAVTVIDRPRLRVPSGNTPVVAVAEGGYGKSVLLRDLATAEPAPAVLVELDRPSGPDELIAALVRSARRDGLSDFAVAVAGIGSDPADTLRRALASTDPLTVIVDEIGRLEPDAAQLLAHAAPAFRAPGRLLLAGRTLPPALESLPGARYLDSTDLAFTDAETADLLGLVTGSRVDDLEVAMIQRLTGGWPAAVAVAAVRSGRSAVTSAPATVLPGPSDVPDAVRALACLPLLSERVAQLVAGPGALAVVIAAGVPTVRRSDGWVELADPVRERLADPAQLTLEQRRAVADVYASTGQLPLALTLLFGADDIDGTVGLLEILHWTALEQVGLPEIRAIVDALPDDALRSHPPVLISAIRMTENGPVGDERQRWIDRALAIFDDDHPVRPLVEAEHGRMAIRLGDVEGATARARTALAHQAVSALARGRAEFVLGMAAVYRGDAPGLRDGMAHFVESIAALHQAGDRRWEAEAHLTLAFGLDYPSGAIARAADGMRRALALLSDADTVRATYLTFLAEVLMWLPDIEGASAALAEAETIAARVYDQRLSAYIQWAWAWIACSRSDPRAATERIAATLRHTDGWYSLSSGLAFHGEAAEILAAGGDEPGAREMLAAGEARPDAADQPHLLVRGRTVIAARYDVPGPAREILLAEAKSPDTRPIDRPRLLLLAAWCSHRAGDDEAARSDVTAAVDAAAAIGHLPTLEIRDPDIAVWARELTGSTAARTGPEITVLGPVRVRRAGDDITPAPGHPVDLIALLAVRGPQPTETVVDLLWPDVDLSTGRSRLRNLLNRIRSSSGDLVDRRGVELALADDCTCDLWAFQEAAGAALSEPGDNRAGLARQALVRADDLLPLVDHEWITGPRRQMRRTTLELLDLVAESAWSSGDLDECRRHLRRAIELEPHDEVRYVRLARVLIRQGRRGSAREAIRRALAAASEIGAEPGEALLALVRQLGKRRETASA